MTDKKFTDKEIIKALEDYIRENEFEYFHSNMMGEYPLIRKSLDFINRQKAENLELRLKANELLAYKQEVTKNNMKNYETYKSQKAEIEKLNIQLQELGNTASLYKAESEMWDNYNKNLLTANTALSNEVISAKTEAYKEFADKLKKKCYEDFEETDEMLAPYVTEDNIDNLLKEMVGEEE